MLKLTSYEKIGEGIDSEVFFQEGKKETIKVYKPHITMPLIRLYHHVQDEYAKLLDPSDSLISEQRDIEYKGQKVTSINCSILPLKQCKILEDSVEGFPGRRVVTFVNFIAGETLECETQLSTHYLNHPILVEIRERLRRVDALRRVDGYPINRFYIDPVNVKVLGFNNGTLYLMITDLAARIIPSII